MLPSINRIRCDFPWHFSEDITPNLKFLSCDAPCPDQPWDSVVVSGTWRSFHSFLSVNFGGMCWKIQVIHGCLAVSGKVWLYILLCSADLKPMDLGHLGSWTYAVPISTTSLCIREASKRSWSSVAIGDFFSAIEVRPWSYWKWS